jgi:DNA-binding transcriptional ArsR family regulator
MREHRGDAGLDVRSPIGYGNHVVTNRVRKMPAAPPGPEPGHLAAPDRTVALSALSALADPTRDAILNLLLHGERAVGEIAQALPVSRPAVSKHLRVLEGAGLVKGRADGTRNVYGVAPEALRALRDDLDAMWRLSLARYALVANNSAAARRRSKA